MSSHSMMLFHNLQSPRKPIQKSHGLVAKEQTIESRHQFTSHSVILVYLTRQTGETVCWNKR